MAKRQTTSFERSIPDYRRRILVSLAKVLLIPPLVSLLLLRLVLGLPIGTRTVIVAILSIPLLVSIRSCATLRAHERAAKSLGATVIPRVKGRWPGNLDVAIRIVKSAEQGYVLQIFGDLLREHGTTTLNTRLFWDDQIITMDASLIKFVCSTGASHFEKGIGWHERVDKLFGTGIFNAEGEIWKTGRATARPFFAKERISDFDIFEQNSVSALDLMASRAHAHLPLDIQDLAARFTLDVAAQFLCGMKLDTLSQPLLVPGKVKLGPRGGVPVDGLTEFDEFSGAIERVAVQMSRRGTQGNTWPLFELLGDKTEESIGTIMNWLEPVVERAVVEKAKRRAAGLETHASENVFIDFLASKTDNVEHIRYELVTYLIASRDATASLVTFVVYFLAMYPATCERLRNDVLEVLGADEPPTYGTLKKMKYLQAVLNETLRLFPSTPRISRSSLGTPLVIPTSEHPALYFPPRTQVMMFSLLLHRRRDLWGADADEFRPERWLEAETTTKLSTTPFMYCPFSGGPRVCTGQEFGLNEAGFFVVKLLQRFKGFTLAPEFQPAGSLPSKDWQGRPGRQGIEKVFPASSFTLHSKGGLWLYGNLAE